MEGEKKVYENEQTAHMPARIPRAPHAPHFISEENRLYVCSFVSDEEHCGSTISIVTKQPPT